MPTIRENRDIIEAAKAAFLALVTEAADDARMDGARWDHSSPRRGTTTDAGLTERLRRLKDALDEEVGDILWGLNRWIEDEEADGPGEDPRREHGTYYGASGARW